MNEDELVEAVVQEVKRRTAPYKVQQLGPELQQHITEQQWERFTEWSRQRFSKDWRPDRMSVNLWVYWSGVVDAGLTDVV